jgi:hypothetical protein
MATLRDGRRRTIASTRHAYWLMEVESFHCPAVRGSTLTTIAGTRLTGTAELR